MGSKYRTIHGLARATGLAVFVALAGCRATQRGAVHYVKQEWGQDGLTGRELTTEHFIIISTLRDAEFEEALPVFVESAYDRYQETLPAPRHPGHRLTMYLFATRSEWARFVQRRFPERYHLYARIRSGGFTEGDTSVSFFVTRAATLATLAHEGWHQYVSAHFESSIPAWLNEGLACFHEAVQFVDNRPEFDPRRNTFRTNSLRRAIQQEKLLTLQEIVSTDAGEVIGRGGVEATERYYAQAWALIDFLRYGCHSRFEQDFQRMLRDITEDTFRVRVSAAGLEARNALASSEGSAAFHAYFGCAPDDLAAEYYNHLIQLAGF